ncbi:MAG TPA: hypothetical protein VFE05_02025 [Longimicrobiaceae bacterium]|jgi:hypothetical protein|nr:hypothetical protein [Longimicrobiaceae bacterium]
MKTDNTAYRSTIRIVLAAAALLLVPLVAMQFTDEVVWTPFDFAAAGTLLVGTALLYQLGVRKATNFVYRAAVGVALGGALFLVWSNLAVGLIGSEDNPANFMYAGVLAVCLAGAVAARSQPRGMARALFATAAAQALVGAIAIILRLGAPESGPLELLGVNGMFVVLFVASAALFRRAALEQPRAGAARPA